MILIRGDLGLLGIFTVSVGHDYRSSFRSFIRNGGVKY